MTAAAASCGKRGASRFGRIAFALALTAAVAGCEESGRTNAASETAQATAAVVPEGSGFDFYVLALSWSPSYCASMGDRANREQCDAAEPFGFVVHGLWPQFETGYPSACPTDIPLTVPRKLSDAMLDIMPSTGLVRHEWREHGTCSGLSQEDYFSVTRTAFETIAVPAALSSPETIQTINPDTVEDAFVAANKGLPHDAISVTCDRRYLRDVRICLSRDLSTFVSCPEVDADACRRQGAVMPGLR